jgi:hypothetical protein
MKKSIVFVALLFTLISGNAFADDEKKISKQVKESFQKEFVNAENVQWNSLGEFIEVTFTMDDQVLKAYYQPEGELISLIRNISSDQLPIHLLTTLKTDYPDYWIVELFEMYSNGETSYFISLQGRQRTLVLTSGPDENWSLYKKK